MVHGGAHVHDDQHLRTHRTGQVHRHVAHQPAVHQHAAVAREGREQSWHGQRGPQRHGQRLVCHLHQFARAQVGGHCPEAQGQSPGRALGLALGQQLLQGSLQRMAAGHRRRGVHTQAWPDPELDAGRHLQIHLATPEVSSSAGWAVREHGGPVGVTCETLQFVGAAPGRVGAPHHRAHAGAHHQVHGHAQLLQHPQHADMGKAARAAAREHQPDPGALRLPWRLLLRLPFSGPAPCLRLRLHWCLCLCAPGCGQRQQACGHQRHHRRQTARAASAQAVWTPHGGARRSSLSACL